MGNQGKNQGSMGIRVVMRWFKVHGNLGMAVEMAQNSSWNDKFIEWREVKILENELIFWNLVSHTWSGAFLVNF